MDCDGNWTDDATGCSVSCGDGMQSQTFHIVTAAANGGADCVAADLATQSVPCNLGACGMYTSATTQRQISNRNHLHESPHAAVLCLQRDVQVNILALLGQSTCDSCSDVGLPHVGGCAIFLGLNQNSLFFTPQKNARFLLIRDAKPTFSGRFLLQVQINYLCFFFILRIPKNWTR